MESFDKGVIEALLRSNILWGKHLVVCGDSFTEGDFNGYSDGHGRCGRDSDVIFDKVRGVYKTYPWWIAERNNMRLTNLAKCGETIAVTKEHLENPAEVARNWKLPFADGRQYEIPEDADYILFMFGLNDSGHTVLGTIDDETPETFYGANNLVYKHLITNFPRAKVGAIVCNSYLNVPYSNAVRETAVKWGIPYLDLKGDMGISSTLSKYGMCDEATEIRNRHYYVSESNHHPNLLAHELMSSYVEDFLRKI